MAETERLRGQHLTSGHCALDDFLSQPAQLAHAEAIQQILEIRRQAVLELRHIPGNVEFAALDTFVECRPLLNQQGADDDHRQNRDHQANAQCAQRREVALPAELQLQSALQWRKDDAEDYRPEHRAVKRQQDPDEGSAHQHQQNRQRFVLQGRFVHVRSVPASQDEKLSP
ncbi:hypothetical protein D3C86_1279950 [compost metagenome]